MPRLVKKTKFTKSAVAKKRPKASKSGKTKPRPSLTRLYPNLTIDIEPMQSGKVVYLPLVPDSKYKNGQSKIVLKLKIKNKEKKSIGIKNIKFSFPKSTHRSKSFVMRDANHYLILKPNKSVTWTNRQIYYTLPPVKKDNKWVEYKGMTDQRIFLNGPGPKYISVNIHVLSYPLPFSKVLELKPHRSPTPRGSYRFPLRSSHKFIHKKFFRTHSDHPNNSDKGGQIFAHDIDVVRLNQKRKQDLFKFDNLDKDEKKLNTNYVGFGEKVYSIASGYIVKIVKKRFDNYPAGKAPVVSEKYGGGNYLKIRYGDEEVFYAHLQHGSIPKDFRKGDFVKSGQFIGKIGNSGRSSHPHIHIESNTSQGFRPLPFHSTRLVDKKKLTLIDRKGIPKNLSLITTT